MVDLRTILAAVLGIALGLALVAFPEAVLQVQTAGRLPTDRRGEYGQAGSVSGRTRLVIRALGAACVALGCYFGWVALA